MNRDLIAAVMKREMHGDLIWARPKGMAQGVRAICASGVCAAVISDAALVG